MTILTFENIGHSHRENRTYTIGMSDIFNTVKISDYVTRALEQVVEPKYACYINSEKCDTCNGALNMQLY